MTYTFGYAGNSYFNGSDAEITRDEDGATIRINVKDRLMAVNVKDHKMDSVPDEIKAAADDLNAHRPEYYGMEHTMRLYDWQREDWWNHDAPWVVQEYDFPGVYSAGRSAGWCAIQGTQHLLDGFRTDEWTDADDKRLTQLTAIYEDDTTTSDEWDLLRSEFYELEEKRDELEERDNFLACCFDLVDSIEGARESFYERILEEHRELEESREANIILSEN